MNLKHISAAAAIALLLPFAASALTADDIQQQIAKLLAQITTLKEQLKTIQTTPSVEPTRPIDIAPPVGRGCPQILRTLQRGARGDDVSRLQEFLGITPTGYFGTMTEAAVQSLQAEEGVASTGTAATTGYGMVGAKTRAALIRRCGGGGGDNSQRFSAYPTYGAAPLSVSFWHVIGGGSSDGYSVDFGDGTTATPSIGCGVNPNSGVGACPRGLTTSHTYTSNGTYIAKLTGQSVCGTTHSIPGNPIYCPQTLGTVTITVSGTSSGAPSISGLDAPTSLAVGQTGTWTVRASAPSGTQLSYSVIWGDEPAPIALSASAYPAPVQTSATFAHAYNYYGTFKPIFTVANSSGSAQTSASVTVDGGQQGIIVTAPNVAGQWDLGSQKSVIWNDTRESIMARYYDIFLDQYMPPCDSSYSCPAWAPMPYTIARHVIGMSYSWTVGNVIEPVGSKAGAGTYKVRVCDSGSEASCDSSDQPFNITDPVYENNRPPVITSFTGPTSLPTGQKGTWVVQASDPEGKKLTYSFSWCDVTGGANGVCTAQAYPAGSETTNAFTTNFPSAGTYEVSVSVSDDLGKSARASATVTVTGTTNPSFSASPTFGSAPLAVTFSYVSGPIGVISINFGDGQSSTGGTCAGKPPASCSTMHTYAKAGTYTATLYKNTCPAGAYCFVGPLPVGTVTITVR